MARIETLARETPGVEHTVGVSGQSLLLNANAPNLGSLYIMLEEFSHRRGPHAHGRRHRRRAQGALSARGARSDRLGLRRPADRRPGHDRRLQADHRGSRQPRAGRTCSGSATGSSSGATARPASQGLFNSSRANTPWLYLDIDRTKCVALGVPVSELFNTLQVYLGSYYVNNFNEFGRSWQVNIQADQRFRGDASDIRQLQVRNNQGQMIRLATLMDVRNTSGPVMVMRYNMYSSTAITGNPAPGTSSGEAIALMQEIAEQGAAAVDGVRLDRAGVHAAPGGQHGHRRLRRWRWSSSSWCWRRSTRAGSCRWRSSWWCRCACSARSWA